MQTTDASALETAGERPDDREASPSPAPRSASPDSPPAFQWEEWYAAVGGRSIRPAQVNVYLTQIRDEQCLRFEGPVAPERHLFASPPGGG